MKRLILLGIISAFILTGTTPSISGEVWRITSLDWQPYSDSQSPVQGKSVNKLRKLLAKEGIVLIVEFYPWARAQEIARQDGYVGYFPAWPEEVALGFIGSPPVDWSEIAVMTAKGSKLRWKDMNTLFQSKIGLISNYEYPEQIASSANEWIENVDPTPNEMALLKKLSARRIDAAITDPTVMLYLAKREGIDNILIMKKLTSAPLVLAFRDTPENRQKMKILMKALKNDAAARPALPTTLPKP